MNENKMTKEKRKVKNKSDLRVSLALAFMVIFTMESEP